MTFLGATGRCQSGRTHGRRGIERRERHLVSHRKSGLPSWIRTPMPYPWKVRHHIREAGQNSLSDQKVIVFLQRKTGVNTAMKFLCRPRVMERSFVYRVPIDADVTCSVDRAGHHKWSSRMHPRDTHHCRYPMPGPFVLCRRADGVPTARGHCTIRLSKYCSRCATVLCFNGYMTLCHGDALTKQAKN